MAFEFVYLLTNPAMPDWVKVGRTNCIQRRLSDLNCTAVPLPFDCYAYLRVPGEKVTKVERAMHEFLGFSYSKEKEFFKASPDEVVRFFKTMEALDDDFLFQLHPDMETSAEKEKSKQTNFKMLGIPVGAVLSCPRIPEVSCVVEDESNQVSCDGQSYSISALACEKLGYNVNGYRVFAYEDETLWQRRIRLEKEN